VGTHPRFNYFGKELIESFSREMLDSSWNVMAHGDAREGKWRGNWRMEWVASTFHTTSEHGVSSITTADAHTSATSRLNWCPRQFKWTRPFRLKSESGFCACVITFQLVTKICLWLLLVRATSVAHRHICGFKCRNDITYVLSYLLQGLPEHAVAQSDEATS
jgi:hypothetical protein